MAGARPPLSAIRKATLTNGTQEGDHRRQHLLLGRVDSLLAHTREEGSKSILRLRGQQIRREERMELLALLLLFAGEVDVIWLTGLLSLGPNEITTGSGRSGGEVESFDGFIYLDDWMGKSIGKQMS